MTNPDIKFPLGMFSSNIALRNTLDLCFELYRTLHVQGLTPSPRPHDYINPSKLLFLFSAFRMKSLLRIRGDIVEDFIR